MVLIDPAWFETHPSTTSFLNFAMLAAAIFSFGLVCLILGLTKKV